MIHIGNLIEKEFRRQERSVSWLAKKLFCERTNIYDIFRRENIDVNLLLRIINVSVQTVEIVKNLPKLKLEE